MLYFQMSDKWLKTVVFRTRDETLFMKGVYAFSAFSPQRRKGCEDLILVNAEEKEIISKALPKVNFIRTVKHRSKRHHYYCEESAKVKALVDQIRSGAY